MSEIQTKFDLFWNAPKTRRVVGVFYSVGAAVVILGAMGKILHTSWGGAMLGIGMGVEAALFLMGVFDKPYKEYEWHKVFDFEEGGTLATNGIGGGAAPSQSSGLTVNYGESLSEADVKKLSEGIKNLATTADQLSTLSTVVTSTDKLTKNIDAASEATGKFVSTQESLTAATSQLQTSYKGVNDGMDLVEKNTKTYAGKVEEINKNLSSINTVYEIQLKNIQAQSEGLSHQTESVKAVTTELNLITADVQRMKVTTAGAAEHADSFKSGTEKLAKQVADLNSVYGNMLNALS